MPGNAIYRFTRLPRREAILRAQQRVRKDSRRELKRVNATDRSCDLETNVCLTFASQQNVHNFYPFFTGFTHKPKPVHLNGTVRRSINVSMYQYIDTSVLIKEVLVYKERVGINAEHIFWISYFDMVK